MAKVKAIILIFCFLIPSAHAAEPFFTKIALSQKNMDLSKNERAEVRFSTPREMEISFKIYDELNHLVKAVPFSPLKAGNHSFEWDGKDDQGEQVVSGVYYYVLEAAREKDIEPTYIHDPRQESGGKEVLIKNLSWDTKKSRVKFLLPQAAFYRVRIGLKEAIFLGTLQDWRADQAGNKEISWEGTDASKLFDLTKHPDAQINVAAFALADNAIIVHSPAPILLSEKPVILNDPKGLLRRAKNLGLYSQIPQYIHARHLRRQCREPRFAVTFPGAKAKDGAPILSGQAPLRITIHPEDKDYLTANRFEIMFFADSQFLFEQEEATSPLTVMLDTAQMGPGDHVLTINVMDYEDHIGAQSLKIRIAND